VLVAYQSSRTAAIINVMIVAMIPWDCVAISDDEKNPLCRSNTNRGGKLPSLVVVSQKDTADSEDETGALKGDVPAGPAIGEDFMSSSDAAQYQTRDWLTWTTLEPCQ
jgi:hypothetical protein